MHILATTSATLDDLAEPVDLGQAPAELVALSFSDSDLAAMHAAWANRPVDLPDLCLTPLRELRHPMSVDLWIDRIASKARVILVRLLGGHDWWAYGCDRLADIARARGIPLALLPGECSEDDARLRERSTVSEEDRQALLACFREGGEENMRVMLRRMAQLAGYDLQTASASPVPKLGFYAPGHGVVERDFYARRLADAPVVPIIFYRSILLAADTAPIDALVGALAGHHINALPVFVPSLRDDAAISFLDGVMAGFQTKAIVTTTAFSASTEAGRDTLFDRHALPVFQAAIATTRHEAWSKGQRGLTPADIAMHVVLPELDGRILAGAISFKEASSAAIGLQINQPEPGNISAVAERIAKRLELGNTPVSERRLVILLPDYPSAAGRAGYAVGLDVPSSVLAILSDLREAGYTTGDFPDAPRDLMQRLEVRKPALDAARYRACLSRIPSSASGRVEEAWGQHDGRDFAFRYCVFGHITVALAPDRGREAERRAEYHDPTLPPCHDLLAFGFWLREVLRCHAILHIGAHGTLEWLPGKAVALSKTCFPQVLTSNLPVIYPFIVSNPGEAAQAKRRIAAVTLGHLPPPMTEAHLSPEQRELERLVDEYAQADGVDHRRRERLAKLIVGTASASGLDREAGVTREDDADSALLRIDSWLCDIKDFAIKDGLHIYGRATEDERAVSAARERDSLLATLDGQHIRPGPAGSPSRGRLDVLPTGRNLYTSDPRTLPTRTACDLGAIAADEVLRGYRQEHGEWPRSLVIDLWGSASLRTGGEEIGQGLALMGCRPQWDEATGRVTGIEVLPPAVFGRPRIDVTWRVSGLFRDLFPAQIALLDMAVAAVAAREEDDHDNPLAGIRRSGNARPARIFGAAPGSYGAGIEQSLNSGDWEDRADLGQRYLASASHSYGGADGEGQAMPEAFAERVAEADLLLHASDDAGRDILEGSAHVAFIGGFSAALAALGSKADLVVLDTSNPAKPRARSLVQAVTLTVRARAVNPRFIAGQMRHGPRGAAEFTETVDRLIGFAETTGAIPGDLIDAVYDAYLGDDAVRQFLLFENPAAAIAIASRFAEARRRDLWHPRRNGVDGELAQLMKLRGAA